MMIRDPKDRGRKIPWFVEGHPIYRYPEDLPHSQSQAWNLALIWETGAQFGVTEPLLEGIANTQVDYVLRRKIRLKDGKVGPPMHIISPWVERARKKEWDTYGRPSLVYLIYLSFNGEMARATRELSGRASKEMTGPIARDFMLFARYIHAKRKKKDLLHLR
jgi:hypothetical protein